MLYKNILKLDDDDGPTLCVNMKNLCIAQFK